MPESAKSPAPSQPTVKPKFVPQAWRYLGISKSSVNRIRQTDLKFPRPVRIPGYSRPVWRVADLDRWADRLPARR